MGINKCTSFFAYRMMIHLNSQMSIDDYLYQNSSDVRHEKLTCIYNTLKEKKVSNHDHRGKKYTIIYTNDVYHNISVFQLVKHTEVILHEMKDDKIDEITAKDFPYVNIIFYLDKQALYIEHKYDVFQDVETSILILKEIFDNYLFTLNATVNLHPITELNTFWESITEYDSIDEFEIELNSPNFFLGTPIVEEMLEEYEKTFHNDSISVSLKNSDGKLRISKGTNLDRYVDFIANGGGRWKIKGRNKKGKKFTNKSVGKNKKVDIINTEKLNEEEIENLKQIAEIQFKNE